MKPPKTRTEDVKAASCPLCGGAARERLQLPHAAVYECQALACRLQFAKPQIDDQALAAAYRRLYYPAGPGEAPIFENTPRDVIVQAIEGIRKRLGERRGRSLLDYGCGKGQFSKVAEEFGFSPVGIEQDAEARREIEGKSLFPIFRDLESLKEKEPRKRFDAIVLWQVIEHLRKPWEDLARLRCLLAEGGWLVAATPNAAGLKARVLRGRWDNYGNPTHFYYFTRQSLRAVFERAGFASIDEWRLKMTYPDHGRLRRGVHRVLEATHLDGDLFFAGGGGESGAPAHGKARAGTETGS